MLSITWIYEGVNREGNLLGVFTRELSSIIIYGSPFQLRPDEISVFVESTGAI